jgi:hypothetical protein
MITTTYRSHKLNYFIEIQKLQLKYGSNPVTEKCLADSLSLFSNFSQDVIQKLSDKTANAEANP